METQGRKLWELFTQQPKLWAGWDHAKTPIGFHDQEQAVLYGHPNPTRDFIEKEGEGVKYHVARPKPVSFSANSSVDLNGVPTATIMWHVREREEMLGLITHEAFHAYQMAANCPFGQIAITLQYPVNDPEIQALAEAEAILLYAALADDSRELVLAALDARKARQALLTEDLRTWEDEVELGEGLATFIEVKTAGQGSRLWQLKLNKLIKINKNAWGGDRLRFYFSGMAWALLCDRYAPGWQEAGWRTLADFVSEALNYRPSPDRRSFPGVDSTELQTRHCREAKERERQVSETLAKAMPGTGLKVEVHIKGNPIGGGWNPTTAVTFPGYGRFHPSGLMYIYDSGAKLNIAKDCLERKHCLHIAYERPDLVVLVDGKTPPQGKSEGSLLITGADSEVSIPKAEISLAGKTLTAKQL